MASRSSPSGRRASWLPARPLRLLSLALLSVALLSLAPLLASAQDEVVLPGLPVDGGLIITDPSNGGGGGGGGVKLKPDLSAAADWLPSHARPSKDAILLPALPSDCPYESSVLPLVLTSSPCLMEMSRRIALPMRGRSEDDALTFLMTDLLRQAPEAREYFHVKSNHLNPRTWTFTLGWLRRAADDIIKANKPYSPAYKRNAGQPAGTDPRAFWASTVNTATTPFKGVLYPNTTFGVPPVYSRDQDVLALEWLASDVRTLSLAYYLLGDSVYAARATRLLQTWFIDANTAMLPSVDAASRDLTLLLTLSNPMLSLVDSLALLRMSGSYTESFEAGMKAWFTSYLAWLQASATGMAATLRVDYVGTSVLSQIISVASYVGRFDTARRAMVYVAANVEAMITPTANVVVPDSLRGNAAQLQYWRIQTLRSLAIVAAQSQYLTDARLDLNVFINANKNIGKGTNKDNLLAEAIAEAVAQAAKAGASEVSLDFFQLRLRDTQSTANAIILATYTLMYRMENELRNWYLLPPADVPADGQRMAELMWVAAAVWDSKHYLFAKLRTELVCPIVPESRAYGCMTSVADKLDPMELRLADTWVRTTALAPVRNTLSTEKPITEMKALFMTVAVFDTSGLPFFMTLGFIGVMRWSSFLFRFIPGLWFLFRESKTERRKYYRSTKYRNERDVTIVVPTIDSGPELQVAITSWLVNRPKRIIFATIHREKENIMRLLRKTCADLDADLAAGKIPKTWLEAAAMDKRKVASGLPQPMLEHIRYTQVDVVSVEHGNKRQQMVAGVGYVDTPLLVLADDDAIWPATALERMVACFDNPNIGGVGTEQTMRPVPKDDPARSWFVIGNATVWEIIADIRLTTKLLENAAATWFGNSISCLSGRTAAYRTCIFKPTPSEGPCNPHANRCFHVDELGFRPEDYRATKDMVAETTARIVKATRNPDAVDEVALRKLIYAYRNAESVMNDGRPQTPPTLNSETEAEAGTRSATPNTQMLQTFSNMPPQFDLDGRSRANTETGAPAGANGTTDAAGLRSRPMHRNYSNTAMSQQDSRLAPPAMGMDSNERSVSPESSLQCTPGPMCGLTTTEKVKENEKVMVNSACLQEMDLDMVLSCTSPRAKSVEAGKAQLLQHNMPILFYNFCIEFCNDYFVQPWNSAQLHSGDDKFLTRYIINRGWQMYCQTGEDARLESTFKPNSVFLKQYMRWTRNTWRSDLRSLFKERAVWKDPHYWFLIYLMFDKMVSPFTLLFGPIMVTWVCLHASLGVSATPGDEDHPYRLPLWNVIVSYTVWICVTRSFRVFPHFWRKPLHILAIPFYVALQYLLAVLKLWCLFTLHRTEWGSRAISHEEAADSGRTVGVAQAAAHISQNDSNENGEILIKAAPELPSAPRPQLLQLPLSPMKVPANNHHRGDRALASPGTAPTPKQMHAV